MKKRIVIVSLTVCFLLFVSACARSTGTHEYDSTPAPAKTEQPQLTIQEEIDAADTADGIFKLPAESGEPVQMLAGEFRGVYAYDGWVYYIDIETGDLCRIPVDGGESEALLYDDPILSYAIKDGGIYSLIGTGDSSSVILAKMDGSSRVTIYSQEEAIDAFNVSQNRLFLLASFEGGSYNVLTIWNMETNTIGQTMDDLIPPVVWCFDSDIVYLLADGVVRFNPDSGEKVMIVG